MDNLAFLPLLCPLLAALLTFLSMNQPKLQKLLHVLGAVSYVVITFFILFAVQNNGPLQLQIGGYPTGIAISFLLDGFSSLMLLVTSITVFATALYSLDDQTIARVNTFYPAFWFMLCGVSGAFSTADLFNLYVWFEVMIMASFILMTLSHEKQVLQGTLYYMVFNILATLVMLLAISYLYGLSGTLDLHHLAQWVHTAEHAKLAYPFLALLLAALAMKSAIFPYYFWLPDSYHLTSVSAGAIFAGLLTKVGIYALIRIATLFLAPHSHLMQILLVVSFLTMLGGIFGAMNDFHIRRILSFHIVSQVGYMSLALAMGTTLALSASIFYIIHHIIVKTNLFLIAGLVSRLNGHVDLRQMGNMFGKKPVLSLLFLIPALSLAGVPPLSGFWAKFLIIKAAFADGFWVSAALALVVGFLTLYSMIKIWRYAFLQPTLSPIRSIPFKEGCIVYIPVVLLSIITLFIGLFPEFLYQAASTAAEGLVWQGS